MLFCDIKFGTVSNVNVPFLSLCNGKLTINKENKPTYVDSVGPKAFHPSFVDD